MYTHSHCNFIWTKIMHLNVILFSSVLIQEIKLLIFWLLYLSFFSIAWQSDSLTVSPATKIFASFCMSWLALANLALMALMLASGSSLKRVGTGPAAASPSNMVVMTGQLDSVSVGMSSL